MNAKIKKQVVHSGVLRQSGNKRLAYAREHNVSFNQPRPPRPSTHYYDNGVKGRGGRGWLNIPMSAVATLSARSHTKTFCLIDCGSVEA